MIYNFIFTWNKIKSMLKLITLLSILLLLPIVNALDYKNHCDNTSFLRKTMEFTSCEGNNCTDYNFTQLVECEFGCDNVTHNCRKAQIYEYAEFFGATIFIIILAGILLAIFKKYG